MPTRLAAPVFTVDAGKMHKIDTTNVENLYSMWTVFNKCAESMEEGRRFENLSWRIWNRETLCCEAKPQFPSSSFDLTTMARTTKETPSLSSSVESAASEDYEMQRNGGASPSVEIKSLRSGKSSLESLSCSRSKAKHVSSQALEKMVISIKETKINNKAEMTRLPSYITQAVHSPAASPTVSLPATSNSVESGDPTLVKNVETTTAAPLRIADARASHSSTSTAPLLSPESDAASSNTSASIVSTIPTVTNRVVRGFTPSSISIHRNSSHLSPTPAALPMKSCLRSKPEAVAPKGNFMLGGSSEDDESSSLEDRMSSTNSKSPAITLQKPQFDRKVTSFDEEVKSRKISNLAPQDEDVFEDSEEDDDVSESDGDENEDDDDDDWEDSASESGACSPTEKPPMFQRVDSRQVLPTRRSMLTTMMHQSERADALNGMAAVKSQPNMHRSRTSTPNGPSVSTSPEDDSFLEMQRSGPAIPRTKPMAMAPPNSNSNPALSPRTTRRNMLATELTESLRKHLLWERQQKNTTANAVLKRRHTAHDNMVNLKNYPSNNTTSTTTTTTGTGSKNNSWNHYFDHGLGEYHQKGW